MLLRRHFVASSLGILLTSLLDRTARAAAAPSAKADHVIVLWMNGGPSHVDTWDPKRGKVAGPGKAIPTRVKGIEISEHLPRLAARADKLAIVRGMTSKEGNHQRAQYLLRTGYAPTPTVAHPSLGAWTSKRLGSPDSGLPAFVSLGGPSIGGGFFGVEHGPFVAARPGAMPEDVAAAPGVDDARFARRMKLLDGMDQALSAKLGDPKIEGRRALVAKAERLMHARALGAFDVSSEPASVRASFGDTPFGRGCLAAVRLVSAGVKFVEVTLDGWDMHQNAFERSARLMGTLDPAMSALLDELERRELARRTVVIWMGEFGRTPRINGRDGRDHHPAAWSAVLAGAGIRGGVVHGETDAEGARVVKDAVRVPDLLATAATVLGLDPDDTAMSPAGRPIALTDDGAPVQPLLL